ncbi:MATE family efflux transporter [Methanobacterium sp.]|uniref:MATE family efflux transporter n=1 Tax=Methanobacterium sp. TaxID=2164 RepID=UPI003C70F536
MQTDKSSQSTINSPLGDDKTKGVSMITGDPKKAIVKLSGPMIISMLLMTFYNLVNAIWVAGLGGDALAAVGFVTPLYLILVGLSNGLGAGAASAIARYIGADNKKYANNATLHSLFITIIISIILTVLLIIFLKPILMLLGAGNTIDLAIQFGQVTFAGTVLMLFTGVGYGILRAEGDAKRTMYAMVISSVINMILDPILIYWAGWGISGAAWGTVISMAFVSVVLLYWFFVKKDTYVSFSIKDFMPDGTVAKNILGVGLPASAEFLIMSILAGIVNGLLVVVAGTDAVAVYSAGWRVVMMATMPIIAVGTSVITVAGVSYGARKYENISIAHRYSIKVGLIIAAITSALTFVFAPYIAMIFAYTPQSASLAPSIAAFLQVMCFFYIFMPPGVMSSSTFQGVGKGMTSLTLTALRNLVFIAIFAYLFAIFLGLGEYGVWWGIVAGDILGGIVGYIWARTYINRLRSSTN